MNKFEKFLREKRVLTKFRRNLKSNKYNTTTIKALAEREGGITGDVIWECFTWEDTPEGHTYWKALARKWQKAFKTE